MDGKVPPIWLGFLRYDAETKESKDLPFLGLAGGTLKFTSTSPFGSAPPPPLLFSSDPTDAETPNPFPAPQQA